jgi:hypothetical protein
MFRFSIRELMLVTLVVGLVAGWWLDRHEDRQQMILWKKRATAFEHVLVEDGWKIDFRPQEDGVIITKPGNEIGEDHGYICRGKTAIAGRGSAFDRTRQSLAKAQRYSHEI